MTEREQQLIEALRKIESALVWHDGATSNDMVLRIVIARGAARDAIIAATQQAETRE